MLTRLLLRQYQHVYRLSRWMRVHFTLMGHLFLIVCLIAGIFGVDTNATTTYQLFVFLSTVFIFSLLASLFNSLTATIKRQVPRYATVGETLVYSVEVTNTSHKNYHDLVYIEQLTEVFPDYSELSHFYLRDHKPWYKRGISFRLWRRYLGFRQGVYIDEQPLPFLGTHQAAHIKISCIPLRRGKLSFSGGVIAKPDLLGLFRRLYYVQEPQTCLVLPRRYPVRFISLSGKRLYQAGGVSFANSVGDSSEFMALREYRQGDAFNHIHWKSLARNNKLIVKQYQDEYFVRRALVLDTSADNLANEVFEAAVSVAASLAMNERQGDALLDLMFVGQQAYRFTTGRGIDHIPHLQEVLAAVQHSDVQSFERLNQLVKRYVQQCSSLFCVFLHWDKQRQDFIHYLLCQNVPLAVFLIHDGTLITEDLPNKPEHFYPINAQRIAEGLAAV